MTSYDAADLIPLEGFTPLLIDEKTPIPKKIQYACVLALIEN